MYITKTEDDGITVHMANNVDSEFYNNVIQTLSLDTRTPIVVISPHLDDAVWSVGPVLKTLAAHGHDLRLINVFSLSLIADDETSLPASGTGIRKAEDAVAGRDIGFTEITYFDFPDGILRDHDIQTVFDPTYKTPVWLANRLQTALQNAIPADAVVLAPSGFGWHIDHQLTARVATQLPQRIIFYEDMPYAARSVRLQAAKDILASQKAKETRILASSELIEEHLRLYRLYAAQRAHHHEKQISAYLATKGYGFWV